MKTYPLGEHPTYKERKEFELLVPEGVKIPYFSGSRYEILCIKIGEKRPPKKGEWYLSGCNENGDPNGWKAPNDLSNSFILAKLVLIQRVTKVKVLS